MCSAKLSTIAIRDYRTHAALEHLLVVVCELASLLFVFQPTAAALVEWGRRLLWDGQIIFGYFLTAATAAAVSRVICLCDCAGTPPPGTRRIHTHRNVCVCIYLCLTIIYLWGKHHSAAVALCNVECKESGAARARRLYEYINVRSMCHMIAVRLSGRMNERTDSRTDRQTDRQSNGRLAGQMTVANLIAFTYADADTNSAQLYGCRCSSITVNTVADTFKHHLHPSSHWLPGLPPSGGSSFAFVIATKP